MAFRFTALVLLALAASPGGFWLLYGTLDPCDALAGRALRVLAGPLPSDPLSQHLARSAGPAMVRASLGTITAGECLDVLWKLEREPGGHFAAAGPRT
jgi:hypothetical protein